MTEIISHKFHETIIREYDIRGIYDETLHNIDAKILGNLFGMEVGHGKTINVGFDGRLSSESLKINLVNGLIDVGINVNEIGLCPTPLLYYSCFELSAQGGIIVTGSHNPKNHNGFKIVLNNKPFFGEDLKKIKKKAEKFELKRNEGTFKKVDLRKKYVSRLVRGIDQSQKINAVWDTGNGVAGVIINDLADKIYGNKKILFGEVDGTFPNHHPDPSEPENLSFCIDYVIKSKSDVGFAFDGDGDRLGVIDDKGRIISGDKLLLILAKELLKKKKKSKIIADVKCSQVIFDEIKKFGGEAIISKTGHSQVKNNLKKYKDELAGEMSGHIFFAEAYYGFDDAFFAAVKVIELLNRNSKKLSELVDEIPAVHNTPEIRIECDDREKFEIIKKVVKNQKMANKDFIDIDGIRVNDNGGWWLLRASNTQPAIVARCESSTIEGLRIQKENVKNELSLVKSSLADKIFS